MKEFLIEYIIDVFFYLPDYAGSRNIGRSLLKSGQCVTTIERMYYGGVGNFIDVTIPDEFVDCYQYTLNPSFYESSFFKEVIKEYLSDLKIQISETEDKIKELNKYL